MPDKKTNRSLLKDESSFSGKEAPKPIPARKSAVQRQIEEQQRQQREKTELLKLRQGIIEESEIIPQDQPEVIPELHGIKKAENFLYHYKWYLVAAVTAVAIIAFMLVDTLKKPKPDLYVLALSTSNASGMYVKSADLETALEKFCPDFDENGYVHVAVNFINLSTENGVNDYTDAQQMKFSSELFTGDSQIYIADSGITEIINTLSDGDIKFFENLSDKYPEAALPDGAGVQLNTTVLTKYARWESCPDINGIYIRAEFENMTGNSKDSAEQRRRAFILLENIVNNSPVTIPSR